MDTLYSPPSQPLGQLVPSPLRAMAGVFLRVHGPGLGEHPAYLFLNGLVAPVRRQRRMGRHLGPIQGHHPQLHQSRLPAQPQYLYKQPLKRLLVLRPKPADGPEVRLLVGRHHPEPHVALQGPGDLPGAPHP